MRKPAPINLPQPDGKRVTERGDRDGGRDAGIEAVSGTGANPTPSTNARSLSANDIDSPAPAREGGGSRIIGPAQPQSAVFWEFAE